MTAPDDAVFALGRSYTNSKEYLSFVVLLGSVLKECQKHESIYDKGQEPGNEADIEEKQGRTGMPSQHRQQLYSFCCRRHLVPKQMDSMPG